MRLPPFRVSGGHTILHQPLRVLCLEEVSSDVHRARYAHFWLPSPMYGLPVFTPITPFVFKHYIHKSRYVETALVPKDTPAASTLPVWLSLSTLLQACSSLVLVLHHPSFTCKHASPLFCRHQHSSFSPDGQSSKEPAQTEDLFPVHTSAF